MSAVILSLLLILASACIFWWVYHHIYLPYIDCQVHLDTILPVKQEKLAEPLAKCAIVIGASFSGLTTASVLSKYFEQVIVIEKCKISEEDEVSVCASRQGNQPHAIGFRSFLIWDKMFPGFREEMEHVLKRNKLSQIGHPSRDLKFNFKGCMISNTEKLRSSPAYSASRGQVECLLRKRVKELKNVKFMYGSCVESSSDVHFTQLENGTVRIDAVTVIQQSTQNNSSTQSEKLKLDCDLLVNCGGNGSSFLFKAIDKTLSPHKTLLTKSSVECLVRYQTVLFNVKESEIDQNGCVAMVTEETAKSENRKIGDAYRLIYHFLAYPRRIGIIVLPYADNTYLIMFGTYNQKIGHIDCENAKDVIMDFAKEYPEMEKDMSEILSKLHDTARTVYPVFEKNGSEYVHYENLNVSQMVALGDAVGSMNPIYGQGVTLSTDAVLLLDSHIQSQMKNGKKGNIFDGEFCNSYQSALSKSLLIPWLLASTVDMMFSFSKYSKNLKFQKMISPIMAYFTERLFSGADKYSKATDYMLKVFFMEQDFRKELFNPVWLFGYLFWKEMLVFAGVVTLALSFWPL